MADQSRKRTSKPGPGRRVDRGWSAGGASSAARRRTDPPTARSGTRKRIEDASRPTLVRLSAMPKLLIPLGTLILVAIGLFGPLPVALLALALVFGFFLWIAYLSWPVVSTGGKVLRGVMLGLVIAMAASRF